MVVVEQLVTHAVIADVQGAGITVPEEKAEVAIESGRELSRRGEEAFYQGARVRVVIGSLVRRWAGLLFNYSGNNVGFARVDRI